MAEREVVYKDAETGFTVVKDMEEPGGVAYRITVPVDDHNPEQVNFVIWTGGNPWPHGYMGYTTNADPEEYKEGNESAAEYEKHAEQV